MSYGLHCALNIRHDDIVYSSLPLYHTAAGILGVGQCFICGCTLALRSKFSASKFWDDCVETKATVSTFSTFLFFEPEVGVSCQRRRMARKAGHQ